MEKQDTAAVRPGRPTLVLNGAGQPLGAIGLSRAVSLVMTGRAATLEAEGELHSPSTTIPAPTVIVRTGFVPGPSGLCAERPSRLAVLARDAWACGWCGAPAREVDHIVPKSKAPGGGWTWENLVASCSPCNRTKADTDPDWSALRVRPVRPAKVVVVARQLARLGKGRWDAWLPAAV